MKKYEKMFNTQYWYVLNTRTMTYDCDRWFKEPENAQAECDRLNGLETEKPVTLYDLNRLEQRLAALEAKDKPAPEPGEFVVEEVWKAQSTEDITIFTRIDKTGRYLCFTDNQVEIRLNANEARKEAIDEYLNLDKIGSHPQYSWSDLKRDIQAIDDYEARE